MAFRGRIEEILAREGSESPMRQPQQRIAITIADDHPAVLLGLQSMLSAHERLEVVASFTSGEALLRASATLHSGVLLLDLRMPGKTGLDCIPMLREKAPQTKILILSSFEMEEEIWRALAIGAGGFVSKSAVPDELYRAIDRVHAGKRYLPLTLEQRLQRRNKRDELSAREIEVLRAVATGDTNRQIAKTLAISEFTVRNHINNVLAKLNARDRTEAAVQALKRGWFSIGDV